MLEIIDYIDTKLEGYKKTYLKLKQKALKEIDKKRSKLEEGKQDEEQPAKKVKKPKEQKEQEPVM